MVLLKTFCLLIGGILLGFSSTCLATDVSFDGRAIKIDGQRRILISGSIHYPRSTSEMWPDLIQKAKEGGLDAIETYVFWDVHEPRRREYNFEGDLDLVRFLKTIQDAGLYAVLRIGPYVCAEWNYGGFPRWLHQMPGIELRTDNQIYKTEMQSFVTLIMDMIKKENLLAPQGGPVILLQIENEYGNVQSHYGARGQAYIEWCGKLAESYNAGVPWVMCQQGNAPLPMINTCNGFYCHDFTQAHKDIHPKMWTENWTGWFKSWGLSQPHRPVEDIAYAVARFFESNGTFQNYYMYHGGTNFGRTSGGPYITTAYDYDAPLDEYGNLRQPKWGHLKDLHVALKSMEKVLTNGAVERIDIKHGQWVRKFSVNGTSGCFLVNMNGADTLAYNGSNYTLPGWSVSILPDCKNEVYNTAKISAQTSLMVMKPNKAEEEPQQLNWMWMLERLKDTLSGKGKFALNGLVEQLNTTGDTSDYLWYMTSVNFNKHDPSFSRNMILRVNTTGHVLHVFVNKKYVGSQFGGSPQTNGNLNFTYEVPVSVKPKTNAITLLSATVGLANYGAFFDLKPTGIISGPVELVGNGNQVISLSSKAWSYKVGLNGEDKKAYSDDSRLASNWRSEGLPIKSRMTWYKTTFKAPLGDDPVVVDLLGMGKGQAWVNGRSIGRYWPSFLAYKNDCSSSCNYQGQYEPKNCRTDCNLPSQRWYHVPRSFLRSSGNSLVLFEEMGGNPLNVNFQTVTVGTVCAAVPEGGKVELSCQGGQAISQVQFASYGDAHGSCGSYQKGTCEASNALAVVQKVCLGRSSCSVDVNDVEMGPTNCGAGVTKKLVVQAAC